MGFRFLHTADWQIGKPYGNVPGDAGAELRAQRLRTVERLAQIATERQLDAVLVAGDVFDSNEVSQRTIDRLLNAMEGFAGPWVLLPGNHDAALAHSVWTRLRHMGPAANIVVADTPTPISLWQDRAVVLPAPLRRRREALDQTDWFDAAETPPGAIRIGLAHGTLPGRLPGLAEAGNPIAENRAATARLDYLALGDWHGTRQIAPRTWYSGTHETDRHRDNDSGYALIVEIEAPGARDRVKAIATGHFAWRALTVDIVDGSIAAALDAVAAAATDPARSVISLTVRGTLGLAQRHALERELSAWEARLHHLEFNLDQLVEEPSDDDLDALGTSGLIRTTVERLKALALQPSHPDADAARVALRMLYLHHMQSDTK